MKVKHWPIPDDEFEKLTLLGELLFEWIPKSKYNIMLRKHNLAFAMFTEDFNIPIQDAQYGKTLPWIKGYIPKEDGGRFELVEHSEARNQKVPNTGELKDTLLNYNNQFAMTARNSQALSDDEENFSWDVAENEISQYNNIKKHVEEKNIAISDLTDEINKYRMITTNTQTQAETFSRESKRLHDKVNLLQQRNLDLEEQVTELYRQNKVLSTDKTRDEAKLNEQEYNAGKIGQLQGMDRIQIIKESAEEIKELMQNFDSLSKTGDGLETHKALIKQMEEKFSGLEKQLETIEKINKKQTKPYEKEKPA